MRYVRWLKRVGGMCYSRLAVLVGVHPKHARKLCVGLVRREAGGPILKPKRSRARRDAVPRLRTCQVRCPGCGAKCRPVDGSVLCLRCYLLARKNGDAPARCGQAAPSENRERFSASVHAGCGVSHLPDAASRATAGEAAA